jgi:hypothetical protein
VSELKEKLAETSNVGAVVFDGVVTQELAEMAEGQGVKYLVGVRSRVEKTPTKLRVLTSRDL